MKGWCWLMLPLLMVPAAAGAADDTLRANYRESRCDRYIPLEGVDLGRAPRLFREALKAEDPASPGTAAAWRDFGFRWLAPGEPDSGWWIAREDPGSCRGRGFYAFHADRTRQTVLLAPHRFGDARTGEIALRLAALGRFRCIAWSTVPRNAKDTGGEDPADLAHRSDSVFNALSDAFVEVLPRGGMVQLHGFEPGKRRTREAESADVIVSAGSRRPTPRSLAVSRCLETVLPGAVRLFPRDVEELGATTNTQGKLLRERGHEGFVHLELSPRLREALLEDAGLLRRFASCLAEEAP